MNFDFNFFFPCYYCILINKQLFVSIDKTTILLYGYVKIKYRKCDFFMLF